MHEEARTRIKIMTEPEPASSPVSQVGPAVAPRKVESLEGFWSYYCDGEDEKKRSYIVVFPQSAYRTVVEHLAEDKTREHGGFLLGYETHIGPGQTPTIVIEEAVPAKFTNGTPVRLTFTTDTWRGLDEHTDRLREQGRILQRVGWYHSHPNISIFLSHWDLDVCKTFDQREYPVALVVDPVNHRGGFFVATKKVYQAHSPQGFYELPDLQVDPMMTWRNMTRQEGPQGPPTGQEGKPPVKPDVVVPTEPGGNTPLATDVRPVSQRFPIIIAVLTLLFSLGGLGVLYEKQTDLAAQLKGTQQDMASWKTTAQVLSKSAGEIDGISANVTDLRARFEQFNGPHKKPTNLSISVTPSRVDLQPSETRVFHAKVVGASSSEVQWTITPNHGTIKRNGEYKAPGSISTEEEVTVKATSVADPSKSSTAVVRLKPQARKVSEPKTEVSVRVTPDHATLAAGGKQTFTATVTGASEPGVTWSVEGDGTIQGGEYSAPPAVTEAKTVKVKATSEKDPTKYGTATVDLNPTPSATVPN